MKSAIFMCLVALAVAQPATASVTLDFEGVELDPLIFAPSYPSVLDFYNGGTSSIGTSGVNYGISFSSAALALCIDKPVLHCAGSNIAKGNVGPQASRFTAILLNGGVGGGIPPEAQIVVNVAAGFDTGFALNYAGLLPGFFEVFDGLDGTGTSLGRIDLGVTPSTCPPAMQADYCPFVGIGTAFSGTAHSVVLGGTTNAITFDDLTFGSAIAPVAAVPEPAQWALMIGGFGLIGAASRRRRRNTGFA